MYSLVGVDGNAYALMGYVSGAMKREGFPKTDVDSMIKDATSGDYMHLVGVCSTWIDKVNAKVEGN